VNIAADRKAQRLARLERYAMCDDAGLAEPADDTVGDVARTFRGAAGQHQHVRAFERAAHCRFKRLLVVRNGAEKDRFAAVLVDGRGDDRTIGVIDGGGTERFSRLHQFIAGGDDGDARPARDG
jgi:hypothetical protein